LALGDVLLFLDDDVEPLVAGEVALPAGRVRERGSGREGGDDGDQGYRDQQPGDHDR